MVWKKAWESTVEEKIESSETVDATTQRGQPSWAYIYITLGFAISIEGTIAGMIPIFPWNIILYLIVAALTCWFWIESDWLHEKLIGLKNRYEAKARLGGVRARSKKR